MRFTDTVSLGYCFPPLGPPHDVLICLICSLAHNTLGPRGAKYTSEGLKETKTLTSLEYAMKN